MDRKNECTLLTTSSTGSPERMKSRTLSPTRLAKTHQSRRTISRPLRTLTLVTTLSRSVTSSAAYFFLFRSSSGQYMPSRPSSNNFHMRLSSFCASRATRVASWILSQPEFTKMESVSPYTTSSWSLFCVTSTVRCRSSRPCVVTISAKGLA